MQLLQNLKDDAEQAEHDAQSATDHAQALGLQFEDIRRDFDDINQIANQKQNAKPKKKGFLKGGKKEHQKEIDAAMLLAEQKSREVQQAHDNLRMAQDNAARMSEEASQKRSQADAYEMQLSDYLTRAHFSQEQEAVPATLSQEEFGAAARGHEYSTTHRYAPSYGSFGDANMSYDNSVAQHNAGMAPMGFGGYPATPARPDTSGQALMGGNPNEGLMGGPSGYYNQNSSTMPTAGQNQNFDDNLMGVAPASSTANGASVASATFPTDSSVAGMSNAGLSYASAKYSINDMSNTGLSYVPDEIKSLEKPLDAGSYVSVQEATKPSATGMDNAGITSIKEDASYGATKPSDASITGMSNAGSYISIQEGSNLDTIPVVAPLPTTEYNTHTGSATDSSIQGSVSRAGTISGYNLNPDYATDASVQGSVSRAGTMSGYNSDAQPPATSAFPLLPEKISSDEFGGIPSPTMGDTFEQKGDTFEQNGGLASFDQSLDYTASIDPNPNVNQNKSFDSGIATPTASNDDKFYSGAAAWGAASQQPVASYQSQPVAYADQNPNLENFVYDSLHEATDMLANAKIENEGTIGNQHAPHVNTQVETIGFSDQPPAPSLDDGIPTPTASNDEYAKFFG